MGFVLQNRLEWSINNDSRGLKNNLWWRLRTTLMALRFFATLGKFRSLSRQARLPVVIETSHLLELKINMVTFTCTQTHARRWRILASTCPKTAICLPHTQKIILSRADKFFEYIYSLLLYSSFSSAGSNSLPIIVRQAFRALQANIFTAFAFSEAQGTSFPGDLNLSSRTRTDNNINPMPMLDLFHDEKCAKYFFRESECPRFMR